MALILKPSSKHFWVVKVKDREMIEGGKYSLGKNTDNTCTKRKDIITIM